MIGLAIALMLSALPQADIPWTAFDEADAQLNGSYRALAASLPQVDRLRLRDAQRNWILLRNKHCGHETRNGCATRETQSRVIEIEARLLAANYYRTMSDAQLFRYERIVDDVCRGDGQDADGVVCKRRDTLFRALNHRGWCWGPDTAQIEADKQWMRQGRTCRPNFGF